MKTIVKEWVAKAEGDFRVSPLFLRARPRPHYCSACFHAYECADKYFKAVLAEQVLRFRVTLPLVEAFARLEKRSPEWAKLRTTAEFLNQFDMSILYPGRSAGRTDARAALDHCRRIRQEARWQLRMLANVGRRRIAGPRKALGAERGQTTNETRSDGRQT